MFISIISILYVIGYAITYWMLGVEHESEGQTFTKGDAVVTAVTSLLSWLAIVIILINTWYKHIGITGYWEQPAKDKNE